ncbi:LysM peptidoglycan-binding domain-containing protein [Olleya sp. YS]|uniref:muramidase family protein n=1 Tax=Olleya sp. YS TaxID=3028318 RepID=UPI0024340D67|nr:LysM peptidoglycan-binding domain-containing protein [Olleya sp. YS]WGD34362.1 LysM peptidoglycan-binding domain-containing protein [Olleya sp. YS]
MKNLLLILMIFCANLSFAQELEEEFLPIVVEDKEAFMSTKTGEYVYRSHADTNPEELHTTASGVVYNDISIHKVVKGETLSSIAKKHKLDIGQLKKDNTLKSNNLSLGQELKIINRVLVPSSSPVISYAGEERIIAKLRPGQSPSTLAPPPPDVMPTPIEAPQKTTSPDAKKPVSRNSTYYKPMIVPSSNDVTEEKEKVTELEESEEVLAARKQLEEAQRQLELAKLKATKKEEAKQAEEEYPDEIEVIESEEQVLKVEEKNDDAKAKYDAIQEKLKKVQASNNEVVKEVSKREAQVEISEEVIEETEVKTETKTKKPVEGVDYHVIVKGDNLYNLSKKYNTTVEKLTKLNDVKFNNLKIGQKLKLK